MFDPFTIMLMFAGAAIILAVAASQANTIDQNAALVAAAGANTPVNNAPQKVQQFSQAIAFAEGFYQGGTIPSTYHNPGDLGPGDCGPGYPSTFSDGSTVCKLPDDATGWRILNTKVSNILTGASQVYNPSMTFRQVGALYAGSDRDGLPIWSNNVVSYLNQQFNYSISIDTVLSDWMQM